MRLRVLFKPKRAINFAYHCMQRALRWQERRLYGSEVPVLCPLEPIEYVLNPLGMLMMRTAYVDFTGVAEPVREIEGLIVLVNAKKALAAAETPPEKVAAFLRERSTTLFHPHTGDAATWGANTGLLSFPGGSSDGYANLPYTPLPKWE